MNTKESKFEKLIKMESKNDTQVENLLIKYDIVSNPIFDEDFELKFDFKRDHENIFEFIRNIKKYKVPYIKNFMMLEWVGINEDDLAILNTFILNSLPDKILNFYMENSWGTLERFKDSLPALLLKVEGQIYIQKSMIETEAMIKSILESSSNCAELAIKESYIYEIGKNFALQKKKDYKMHSFDLHLTYLPEYDESGDDMRVSTIKLKNMVKAMSGTNLPQTLRYFYMSKDQYCEDDKYEQDAKKVFTDNGFKDVKILSDDRCGMPNRAEGEVDILI